MSAPAPPHRPSPANMPRRAAAPAAIPPGPQAPNAATRPPAPHKQTPAPHEPKRARPGASTTPGVLLRRERLRPLLQQAMRISRMLPHSRLVALTLLGYSHYETGLIRRHPTTAELAYATGLTKAQVLVQIEILTQRGWLQTKPLPTGPHAGELAPQLCIPAPLLDQIRARAHEHMPTG